MSKINLFKNLAQRFRVKKVGNFWSDEPLFFVRCAASNEKNGEVWLKIDLFWPKLEWAKYLLIYLKGSAYH